MALYDQISFMGWDGMGQGSYLNDRIQFSSRVDEAKANQGILFCNMLP